MGVKTSKMLANGGVITLNATSDPAAPTTGVKLYAKTVSGQTEYYVIDSNSNVMKVTSEGKLIATAILTASGPVPIDDTDPSEGDVPTYDSGTNTVIWSSQTGGPPSGSAGGDLGGSYPNPTVTVARGLKSATTTVSVSAATAPSNGQVLTATSSTTATWQSPASGAPTGSASGDLGGSYPSPTVTQARGLKSATTTVAVSSATAPTSGQVLTATSSTAATWQDPAGGAPSGSAGGDLGGTYPNPTVTVARGLKSATTTVAVSSATAPSAGQVLTATSSTAAEWATPSSGSPSGSAGGDLGGTYPNPTVTQARGLMSATTTVSVSSATAPSAGQVLTASSSTAALWASPGLAFGNSNVTTQTASFTAAAGGVYECKPSSATCVVTLPTTHARGDLIVLFQGEWSYGFQVTCPSGHNLCAQAGPVTRSPYQSSSGYPYGPGVVYLWSSSTTDWWIVGGALQ